VAECRVPENRVRVVVSSLVSSVYVRLRSLVFKLNAMLRVTDVNGLRRTVIPTPENQKVGGSTPPLATKLLVEKLCQQGIEDGIVVDDEQSYAENVVSGPPKNKFRASLLWRAIVKTCG
jgi:hypothetical protein